ncbi:MAG: hypothetical protein C0467_07370 [Planctomycetaceae bacterium]|nr:hypothetical protein [Planctomycetaceae bacterium]
MRRFLPAAVLALLAIAVASPVNAGYLIIRIVLEGTGGAHPMDPGGIQPGGPPVRPPVGGEGGIRPPVGGVPQPPIPNPGGPLTAQPSHDPTRSLVIVLPVEEDLTRGTPFYAKPAHQFRNPIWQPKLHLTLHNEKIVTNLFTDGDAIQWYTTLKETPALKRSHVLDVRERYAKWAKTKTDLKVGYNLIVEALGYAMVDDAVQYSDDLLSTVQGKKDGLPPEVASFVRAYEPIQAKLKAAAPKRAATESWQAKLEAANLTPSPHYAIMSWDATEEEVRRRITLLEENFKAFFLWHATRGITLKVPETPLLVALAKQGRDVKQLAAALDAPPRLIADGFYSAEHGILVLSPERLDSLGQTFTAQTRDMYRDGVSRKELLAGRGPDIDINGQNGMKKPDDVARLQTVALIERMVDEQAAICAISREGSLQLLYATDQIPQYVALPEWVTNGAVNFFTRPKDPAFITGPDGKQWMTVAPTPGYGVPNYVLQRQFRDLYAPLLDDRKDKKEIPEQRAQRVGLLKNVLADAYFLGLRDPKDVNDPDPIKQDKSGVALNSGGTTPNPNPNPGPNPRPGPGGKPPMGGPEAGNDPTTPREDVVGILRKKREVLGVKAQSTSWALYYYLAKDRPDELRKFLAELASLPRDLPLDSATITAAFYRSFGLAGTPESLAKFADAWLEYIRTVPPVGIDIPLVDPKPGTPGMNPMNPMGMNPGNRDN